MDVRAQHGVIPALKCAPLWCKHLFNHVENGFQNRRLFTLIGILLLPTLFAGLMADDHYHATRLLFPGFMPSTHDASIWQLFTVSDGKASTNLSLIQKGLMPWWTDLGFRFQMWRPLAELSHWLDYRLWPNSPFMMHLHHLAWVATMLTMVLLFYRKFTRHLGLLALAFSLFALSANQSQTLVWLASRNTLMAITLGIAALLLHVKSRESMHGGVRLMALIAFSLALMASEYGLSCSAWLFAWTITLDRGNWMRRFARLLPYGVIMLAWAWIYVQWKHGVAQSDFYIDPVHAPLAFILALSERVPGMFFGALFNLPNNILGSSDVGGSGWLAAVLATGLFLLLIRRKLLEPVWQFFLLGSLLSMVPIAAGPGGPRTLAFVSLGLVPFMAYLLKRWVLDAFQSRNQQRLTSLIIWPMVITLLLGLIALPLSAALFHINNRKNVATPALNLPISSDDATRQVVLLNPNSVLFSILYPTVRASQGHAMSQSMYPLASGQRHINLQRDSENSFIMRPEQGFMIDSAAFFMRPKSQTFEVGETIKLPDMSAEIMALAEDGRPSIVRFQFPVSLESQQLKLLQCKDMLFLPLKIPRVGEQVTLTPCER